MAEPPKKSREIDLRSRLSKAGAPPQTPKSGAPGSLPVPPMAPQGGFGPRASLIPGAEVKPPPFGMPNVPPTTNDPFAAQAAAGPREVRIVVDERPVTDSEVGRSSKQRFMISASVIAVVALAAGYGFGNTMADRRRWNVVVSDAKDINLAVNTASDTVLQAQKSINQAIEAASPAPGATATVDVGALQALKALKKPLDANAFSSKHYKAFRPETVNALFAYYNNINQLWSALDVVVPRAETNKAQIERAAKSASELASVQYGCVPSAVGDSIACSLSVVSVPPQTKENEAIPKTLKVSARVGGVAIDKVRYQGQDLNDNPTQYVMLVDTRSSVGVLGQAASAFANYRKELVDLKKLADETVELQGRLIRDLGDISKHEKVLAF
jgi:hypothetical protein